MSRKIVINTCYGGFGVSEAVFNELGIRWDGYGFIGLERDDPKLIAAIEKIGLKESSGQHAELKIVEIPDDVEWTIKEYDGIEWVAEKHQTWD